jgi:hypothetical protein
LKLILLRPERAHFGQCVTRNHIFVGVALRGHSWLRS